MLSDKEKNIILEQIYILDKLYLAFLDSLEHIKEIDINNISTFREWEPIDAFLDRFERLIDFIYQRIFRTIYKIENRADPVSLIELINFIVKKGFAEDLEFLIYLKDLRNRIAHEYIGIGIYNTIDFINEIIDSFNKFKPTIDAIKTYFEQYR